MDKEHLRALIAKLPVLDLTWPQDKQDQWWGWLIFLMSWARAFIDPPEKKT